MKAPINKEVRVRYAPSPTGPLHIGGARTALFNYLFAKKYGGKFVLRLEDTDFARSKPEFEQDIFQSLIWLGIQWDEGPVYLEDLTKNQTENQKEGKLQKEKIVSTQKRYIGKYGPYRQSERTEIYAEYLKKLLKENKAYFCFCDQKELEKERKLQLLRGEAPKYSGRCANLTAAQVKKFHQEGKKSVIRFRVPPNKKIKFFDLIRGELEFDSNLIGDIVIAKDLKTPLYNFAVVIDDYLMKISHVIRGEDHLSNTPKQILLQEALGLPYVQYAHLPLILGPDRSKLSKRHGATSVMEYKKAGYLPEAMINFIAYLGWNPKTTQEFFSLKELISEFDLKKVGKAGAVFNLKKLDWLNGVYIRKKDLSQLTKLCLPYLIKARYVEEIEDERIKKGLVDSQKYKLVQRNQLINFEDLTKVIALEKERMKKLSEITELLDFYFKKEVNYLPQLLIWKKTSPQIIKNNLKLLFEFLRNLSPENFQKDELEKKIKEFIATKKMGTGETLWPFRVALTGKQGSPSPFEVAEVLGKEVVLERVKKAIFLLP